MALRDRLQRLEGGQPESCEECGQPDNAIIKNLFDDRTIGDVDEEDLIEDCPECFRQVLFPVFWGGPHNPLGGLAMLVRVVPKE